MTSAMCLDSSPLANAVSCRSVIHWHIYSIPPRHIKQVCIITMYKSLHSYPIIYIYQYHHVWYCYICYLLSIVFISRLVSWKLANTSSLHLCCNTKLKSGKSKLHSRTQPVELQPVELLAATTLPAVSISVFRKHLNSLIVFCVLPLI